MHTNGQNNNVRVEKTHFQVFLYFNRENSVGVEDQRHSSNILEMHSWHLLPINLWDAKNLVGHKWSKVRSFF